MRLDTHDLWPEDLRAAKTKAPATILREQGALLGRKTNNLLLGRVLPTHPESSEWDRLRALAGEQYPGPLSELVSAQTEHGRADRTPSGKEHVTVPVTLPFAYSFYIVAPVLDDYAFELFSIRHGVDLYPVFITMSKRPRRKLKATTEAEFLKQLREIFASEETTRVIESLLAQSQAPV